VRQLLVESMLLAAAGGVAGLVVAIIGIDLLVISAPTGLPRIAGVGMDWRVLAFSLSVSLVSGLAFGIIPIWQVLRTNFLSELKEGGTSSVSGRHTTQNVIIAGEFALAIILLLGSGLVLRSTQKALNGNPGFDPKEIWSFGVLISPPDYGTAGERRKLFKELETRFEGTPEVHGASVAIGGLPKPVAVNPKYLRLMGIRLLKGRFFDDRDTQQSPPVIVIDETLARARFRNEDPVGQPFSIDLPGAKAMQLDRPREVIGVVSHIQRLSLETDDETVIQSQFYLATDQLPDELIESIAPRMLLKVPWPEKKVPDRLEAVVHAINPNLEVSSPVKMQDAVERALLSRKYVTKLFAVFALIAFVLAGMGVFGLMSYSVSQRTQEIGVRMSLGGEPRHIIGMVVRHAVLLAGIGIAIGLLSSFWLKKFVEYLLYDITAADPVTYVAAVALLFSVALFAAYLPASHISRLEPSLVLRSGRTPVRLKPATPKPAAVNRPYSGNSCIEVLNLHKTYAAVRGKTSPALSGVSFEIEPGTIFGLIGQNGAGKTTLVKILMGLARQTAGSARLLGCLPGDPIAKQRIGYLPEHMRIPDHFYPENFLRYMGKLNAVDSAILEAQIPAVLEKVGLGGVHKPVKSFSKGMQQRLGLAQALLNDPELLFLDEPTDGLDPLGRIFVRDLLVQLRSAGKTVFLNSHLLSEIELVCDRIVILDKGVVACTTTPAEFTSGAGDYVIKVAPRNETDPEQILQLTRSVTGSAAWQDGGIRFKPRDTEQLNDVLDALRRIRLPILSVEPVKLSLEQFFIQVVGQKES
jgi:ABC-type multidrug transport system ATPase subunit/ABC-type antimicrobial peptide transport system permease subunit